MTTESIAEIRQRWSDVTALAYTERVDGDYIIDARLDAEYSTLIEINEPDQLECYALKLVAHASRDVPALLAALDAATERAARICEDVANEHTSEIVRGELLMIARLIRNPEVAA